MPIYNGKKLDYWGVQAVIWMRREGKTVDDLRQAIQDEPGKAGERCRDHNWDWPVLEEWMREGYPCQTRNLTLQEVGTYGAHPDHTPLRPYWQRTASIKGG